MIDKVFVRRRLETYLTETGSEDNNLVDLSHLFEEIVHAGTLDNVHVMPVVFDFHRDDKVSMLDGLPSL